MNKEQCKVQSVDRRENPERQESLVKVLTVERYANVIIGGDVFISTEDAKAILHRTVIPFDCVEPDMQMLHECRSILRNMAKSILFTPADASINLNDISSRYL